MDKLNKLIKKFINKETILYLIFGVLTTILNIAICGLLYDILHWDVIIATVIAWIAAVIFAFITNKIFVFNKFILTVDSIMIKNDAARKKCF